MTAAEMEEAAVVMRVVKEVEALRNRGIGIVTTPLSSRRFRNTRCCTHAE